MKTTTHTVNFDMDRTPYASRNKTWHRTRMIVNKALQITVGLVLGLVLGVSTVWALSANEIMEKVDARDDGDRSIAEMEMVLIDKSGNRRVRKIRSFGRDQGEDTQSVMLFMEPADVRDTGFLTFDYDAPEADDDQWLYLPALRKVKRIATGDKTGSFMGSDFSYSDMTKPNLEDYKFQLLKESEVRGHPIWVIGRTPVSQDVIEETGYTKSILYVRKDNFVVVRAIHFLDGGKKRKYLDVIQLKQIDGIWVATETHMTTKRGKTTLHKTIIRQHNMRFNQELEDSLFTTRRLEKGL